MADLVKLVFLLTCGLGSVLAQLPPDPTTTASTTCSDTFRFAEAPSILTDINGPVQQRCSGILQVAVDTLSYPICDVMSDLAAERACWQAGVNLDVTRNIRLATCKAHQTGIASLADKMIDVKSTENVNLHSQGPAECIDTCMVDCYGTVVFPTVDPPDFEALSGNCGRPDPAVVNDRALAAVACIDRDECQVGILYDCMGPLDCDCQLGEPCAANTMCTNTPESFHCNCTTGYEALAADDEYPTEIGGTGAGCVDIDECTSMTSPHACPDGDICQNTIGSYVCVCNKWKLYDNPGVAGDECDAVTCADLNIPNASPSPVPMDEQADSVTVTCGEGYTASNSQDSKTFDVTCRDGRWCSCNVPYCERKPCGDPGSDPFSTHPTTPGLEGDIVLYTCGAGSLNDGAQTYTKQCTAGVWISSVDTFCSAVTCTSTSCHADANCKDLPGGFFCTCKSGYIGDGITNCEMVNLCSPPNPFPCHAEANCIPILDTFICMCKSGFTGDGFTACETSVKTCGTHPKIAWATSETITDGIEYTCAEGYTIDHAYYNYVYNAAPPIPQFRRTFRIYCSSNGLWEPQPIPHCYKVSCGDPGICLNAKRSATTFLYEDKVTYTCQDGFTSTGPTPASFEITCQKDGTWTNSFECRDIDECLTGSPCGDSKHLCINTEGGYSCSCALGYRPSNTGRACEPFPEPWIDPNWPSAPCDFFDTLNLCGSGTCQQDSGKAECVCEEGYAGTFCTDRTGWRAFDILSVIAMVMSGMACIFIFLFFCLCFNGIPRVPPPVPGPMIARPYGLPTRMDGPRYPSKVGFSDALGFGQGR